MKKGFVPVLIIVLIIATVALVVAGIFAYKKLKIGPGIINIPLTSTKSPSPTTSPSPITIGETANWKTYTNTIYGYSIKYASNYELRENQTPSTDGVWASSPGVTSILVPTTNGNFSLEISSEEIVSNSTLENWSGEIKCKSATEPQNTTIAGKQALVYKDTPCGIAGNTEIYLTDNNVGYKFIVSSFVSYDNYKEELNQILSTFKFLE